MATASYAIFGQTHDFRIYNYTRVTAAATALVTTVIKTTPGVLRSVSINTVGVATGTFLVEDGTASGATVIASISGTAPSGSCLQYDANFTSGLVVVAASGSPDVTVTWK